VHLAKKQTEAKMIILQAAIGYGIFLCFIACILLFIAYPITIFLFIFLPIKARTKKKHNLTKRDYFIMSINGFMYASVAIVALSLLIYFLLTSFVDLTIS
jgi:hypothetical protein